MSVRARNAVVGALGIVCGLLYVAAAFVRQHARCDRHEGVCTIRDWPFLDGETLPLDAIREHKFWLRREGVQWGETLLVDRTGRWIRIGAAPVAAARVNYAEFLDFYEGRSEVVELTSAVQWFDVGGGLLIVLLAGVWWHERRGGRRSGEGLQLEWP